MGNVAINGFGRIGRSILRIIVENDSDINVVAINDLGNYENLAYLLKHDSVMGILDSNVSVDGDKLIVDDRSIQLTSIKDPADLPWKEMNVDVVVESTGIFRDSESLNKHLDAGAKKVLLTVPPKDDIDATIVLGVNDSDLKPEDKIVSNASCTTNCLAPIAKVLDQTFGINKGLMTTIHSYTGDLRILDNSHRDLRRARAAATNIVPTSTGAAKAVALVYPEMKGKLTGIAMRVPTPNVSAVDFVFESSKSVTAEEVNNALKEASLNSMKGIIKYGDEPLVSSDYAGTNESSIVDSDLTMCIGDNLVKVLAWYDNEWGYSQRVVDLAEIVAKNWE